MDNLHTSICLLYKSLTYNTPYIHSTQYMLHRIVQCCTPHPQSDSDQFLEEESDETARSNTVLSRLMKTQQKPPEHFADDAMKTINDLVKNQLKTTGLHVSRWATYITNTISHCMALFLNQDSPAFLKATQIVALISNITTMVWEFVDALTSKWKFEELSKKITSSVYAVLFPTQEPGTDIKITEDFFDNLGLPTPRARSAPPPRSYDRHTDMDPPNWSENDLSYVKAQEKRVFNPTPNASTHASMPSPEHSSIPLGFSVEQPGDEIPHPQGKLNPYTLTKKILGILIGFGTLVALKGDKDAMSYVITLGNFKRALKEGWADTEGLVDFLVEDLIGFEWGDDDSTASILTEKIEKIDSFILKSIPSLAEDPGNLLAMQKEYISVTKLFYSLKDYKEKRIVPLIQTLQAKSALLFNHFEKLAVHAESLTMRFDPVVIEIKGEFGVGKTSVLLTHVIPTLSKELGLKPNAYTVKMSPEEKYFPEYANQDFFIFDEALATGSKDPLVTKLNSICSSGHYNMEGAYIKHQPCHAKIVFVVTNNSTCPDLKDALSDPAQKAFWSRMNPYLVTFPLYDYSKDRDEQVRYDDLRHLEFYKEHYTFSSTNGQYQSNSAKKITINQIILDIKRKYQTHQNTFLKLAKIASPQGKTTSHPVFHINGRSGTGKTQFAQDTAAILSQITKMPIIEYDNYIQKVAAKKAIYIFNDVLECDELNYIAQYNTASPGSIFFITSNLHIKTVWRRNAITWDNFVPLLSATDSNWCKTEGTPRRLGIPGNHVWKESFVQVPETEAFLFSSKRIGHITDSTGKDFYVQAFASRVIELWQNFMKTHCISDIVEGIVPDEADIQVHFDNWDKCISTLSSVTKTFFIFTKPTEEASVKVSPRALQHLKQANASMFIVSPDVDVSQDRTTLIKNLCSNLRRACFLSSVRVSIGNEKYYSDGSTIITEKSTEAYTYTIDRATVAVLLNGELIFTVPCTVAAQVLSIGLTDENLSLTEVRILQSLQHRLLKDPAFSTAKARIQTAQILKEKTLYVMENKESKWCLLKAHPWFPVCTSIIGLLGLTAFSYAIYSHCKSNPTPIEKPPIEQIVKRELEEEEKLKNSSPYNQSPSARDTKAFEDEADRNKLSKKERVTLWNMRLSQERNVGLKFGKEELRTIKKFIRGMDDDDLDLQSIYNLQHAKTTHGNIIKMFEDNMVLVHSDSTVKGLGIFDRYVLTVAHVWKDGPVMIEVDQGNISQVYLTEIVRRDLDFDLMLLRVTDKRMPMFKDIRKHIVTLDDLKEHGTGFMVDVESGRSRLIACAFSPYYQSVPGGLKKDGRCADFYGVDEKPTQQGSCGNPYLLHKHNSSPKLIGLHVAGYNSGFQGIFALIALEKLNSFMTIDVAHAEGDKFTEENFIQVPYSDGKEDIYYSEQYNKLIDFDRDQTYIPPMEKIFSIGRMPNIKHLARKPSHIPTDFSQSASDSGFVCNELPSPTLNNEYCIPPPLKTLKGLPSYLVSQIEHFSTLVEFDPSSVSFEQTRKDFRHYMYLHYGSKHEIVSEDIAINGFPPNHEYYTNAPAIDMASSVGAVFQHLFKITKKGDLFTGVPGQRVFSDTPAGVFAKNLVMENWSALMKGYRFLTINTDKVKAELQDEEKCLDGRCRLFSVASPDEVVILRRIFLTQVASIHKNRFNSAIKIGTCPELEYTSIRLSLLSKGPNVVEFDIKRCDKYIHSKLIETVYNQYNPIGLSHKILKALARITSHGFHWASNALWTRERGNNSGGPLTSKVDSEVVLFACIYVANRIIEKHGLPLRWNEVSLPIVYNDDVLIGVATGYEQYFGSEDIASFMGEIGFQITYDSPVPISVDEATFLSRTLSAEEGILVIPRLKISSIVRHLFWTTSKDNTIIAENLNIMLDEICYYEEKHYNKFFTFIMEHLAKRNDKVFISLMDLRPYNVRRNDLKFTIRSHGTFIRKIMGSLVDEIRPPFSLKQLESLVETKYGRSPVLPALDNKCSVIFDDLFYQANNNIIMAAEFNPVGTDIPTRFISALESMVSDHPHLELSWTLKKKNDHSKIPRMVTVTETRNGVRYPISLENHQYEQTILEPPFSIWKGSVCGETCTPISGYNIVPLETSDLGDDFPDGKSPPRSLIKTTTQHSETPHLQAGVNKPIGTMAGATVVGSLDATSNTVTDSFSAGDTVVGDASTTSPCILTQMFGPPQGGIAAGGFMNNLFTTAYNTYIDVNQYNVTSATARGTEVFKLPYEITSLNPIAQAWVNHHQNYEGPILWKASLCTAATYFGQLIIGVVEDISKAYTIEELEQRENFKIISMNATSETDVEVSDIRQNLFYRKVDGDIGVPKPGIICMVYVPLSNSVQSESVSLTLTIRNKLAPGFICTIPRVAAVSSPTTASFLEGSTLASLCGDSALVQTDGFRKETAYFPARREVRTNATTQFVIGTDKVTQETTCMIHNDGLEEAFHGYCVKVFLQGSGDIRIDYNTTPPASDNVYTLGTSDYTAIYDNSKIPLECFITIATDYSHSVSYAPFVMGSSSQPFMAGMIGKAATFGDSLGTITMTQVGNNNSGNLPGSTVAINFCDTNVLVPAGFITNGNWTTPPTTPYMNFIDRLHEFVAGRILQFDLISTFSSTPIATCRYDPALRAIYADFGDRDIPYSIFSGAVAGDIVLRNSQFVTQASSIPVRSQTNFIPRQADSRAVTRRTGPREYPHKQAAAAIMTASLISGGLGGASSTGSSLWGNKKQREHELEMQQNLFAQQQLLQSNMYGQQNHLQNKTFAGHLLMQHLGFAHEFQMGLFNTGTDLFNKKVSGEIAQKNRQENYMMKTGINTPSAHSGFDQGSVPVSQAMPPKAGSNPFATPDVSAMVPGKVSLPDDFLRVSPQSRDMTSMTAQGRERVPYTETPGMTRQAYPTHPGASTQVPMPTNSNSMPQMRPTDLFQPSQVRANIPNRGQYGEGMQYGPGKMPVSYPNASRIPPPSGSNVLFPKSEQFGAPEVTAETQFPASRAFGAPKAVNPASIMQTPSIEPSAVTTAGSPSTSSLTSSMEGNAASMEASIAKSSAKEAALVAI